jgi:hypothetical protein
MQTVIKWNKSFLSSTYNLFSNGEIIGQLKENVFSQTAYGDINGKKYIFRTKGFLKQHTEIIDANDGHHVGEIAYNSWMTKATLMTHNKSSFWRYDNVWNTRWRIFDSQGLEIKYAGNSSKGQIISNTDDPLLLLSGLFVTNYYWQTTVAVIIAISVPIWASVIHH